MSDDEFAEAGDAVYQELLERAGEGEPRPRLEPTRRLVEILGDPQRAYPIIHITGTNGKTSTSRIIESVLRAYGLRTGLFTSPHLVRFNERIMIDGVPISNEALARNWDDIKPYVAMVDKELTEAGGIRLTFFELVTALGFASFADAPVDVAVIEVGMGGEWDSTNVGDGQVAVFTPISLDHTKRLGSSVAEIARTKAGIIKPAASVVTSSQPATAFAELARAASLTESSLAAQGAQFDLVSSTPGVGGQVLSVRGLAGTYEDLFLPLLGEHQAQNAAVAIAAIESFLGRGIQPLNGALLAEGFARATSPGRMQVIGTEPTVLIDAAHNPAGAEVLAAGVKQNFSFDELTIVTGILADKDAAGILRELGALGGRFVATQSSSERSIGHDQLAELISRTTGQEDVPSYESLAEAIRAARDWAADREGRAVLVTGSITLIGEATQAAMDEGWKSR